MTNVMPLAIYGSDSMSIYDKFPEVLEPESDIILFKNGALKPNIHGSINVDFLEKVILHTEDFNKGKTKKEKDDSPMFNLYMNGNNHRIEAVVGGGHHNITNHTMRMDLVGSGELHYMDSLADIADVLSGDIKFFTIDRGPLWLMQDIGNTRVRYLVPPAAPEQKKNIRDYGRVKMLIGKRMTVEEISYATGISRGVVEQYKDLHELENSDNSEKKE